MFWFGHLNVPNDAPIETLTGASSKVVQLNSAVKVLVRALLYGFWGHPQRLDRGQRGRPASTIRLSSYRHRDKLRHGARNLERI